MTKKSILTIITEFSDIQNMIDFFQSLIVFQNTKKISPTNEDSTSKRLQKRRNSISIPQTHEVTIKKNIQKINSLTSDSNIKNDTNEAREEDILKNNTVNGLNNNLKKEKNLDFFQKIGTLKLMEAEITLSTTRSKDYGTTK